MKAGAMKGEEEEEGEDDIIWTISREKDFKDVPIWVLSLEAGWGHDTVKYCSWDTLPQFQQISPLIGGLSMG